MHELQRRFKKKKKRKGKRLLVTAQIFTVVGETAEKRTETPSKSAQFACVTVSYCVRGVNPSPE